MTAKRIAGVMGFPMLLVSAGAQVVALAMTLYDLGTTGRVNFSSVFGYGAAQPFTIPTFLIGYALTFEIRSIRSVKWLTRIYLASHLAILSCAFAFPGRFGP